MDKEQTSRRVIVMLALVIAALAFSAGCSQTPGMPTSTAATTPTPTIITTTAAVEGSSAATGTEAIEIGTVPSVPSTESDSTGTTETVTATTQPRTTSSTPVIRITAVSDGYVTGQVEGVDVSDMRVTLYIRVRGAWWGPKPYWDDPYTTIKADGTWRTPYITGGVDNEASEAAAYLIPASSTPPNLHGDDSLPGELSRFPGVKQSI